MRMCAISFAAACLAACGDDEPSGGDEGPSPPANLDPDAPPVLDGDWYRPVIETTWQWQLQGEINSEYDVEVYDIDLFDVVEDVIAGLQAQGRRVLCYFSAGSGENWRDDYSDFLEADLGKPLDDWEGERWVDIRSANVVAIMEARLDLAVTKGCDGVEPDNVTAFDDDSGFDLSARDQLAFNRHLANEAHSRGLTIALKNDGDQVGELEVYFDLSVNEECHEYTECDQLSPFLDAGKPIFNAEYAATQGDAFLAAQQLCPMAAALQTRTLVLPLALDDQFRETCG